MIGRQNRLSRAQFGFDAPAVPAVLASLAGLLTGSAVIMRRRTSRRWPAIVLGGYAVTFALTTVSYLYTTLRGKFLVWDELLDRLRLNGDERVLDLGCGSGTVLLAAASRIPHGRAIGVDVWRGIDQSGNTAIRTQTNAEVLDVADRIELHTADITSLPLPDKSVDVVLSSVTLHNIHEPSRRAQALQEAVRVLRPGGRLLIVDFQHSDEYRRELLRAGTSELEKRSLGWRFRYGNPWTRTDLVSAVRPERPGALD